MNSLLFRRSASVLSGFSFVAIALELGACAPAPAPIVCPPAFVTTAPDGVDIKRILVSLDGTSVVVTGLKNSVAADASVSMAGESAVDADANGRFSLSLELGVGPERDALIESGLLLEIDGVDAGPFRLHDGAQKRLCAVGSPIPTGASANDLALTTCGNAITAFVPVSTDSAMDAIVLSTTAGPIADTGFPLDNAQRGGGPWHVAFGSSAATASLAAVSLQSQDAVALVDACSADVLSVARAQDGEVFAVSPPLVLSSPLDVDGDGVAEGTVDQMLPRAPQGVAWSGDRVFVSFTNLLEAAVGNVDTQRLGPGLVVAYDLVGTGSDRELVEAARIFLPFQNPQSLVAAPDGRIWASATGPLALEEGRCCGPGGESGLVAIDPQTLEIDHTMTLTPFVPATPTFVGETIVVGSLLRAEVAWAPTTASNLDAFSRLSLGDDIDRTDSVFEIVPTSTEIVFALVYGRDEMWAIDVSRGEVAPPPLNFPIVVGPGGAGFRGPIAAAFDAEGRGAVVLNLSSEVRPIDLREVFGP